MRAFIVFSCLALAAAKPEYSYNPPQLLGSGPSSHALAAAPLQSYQSAPLQTYQPAPLQSYQSAPLQSYQPAPLQSYQPAPISTSTVQKHIYVHVPPQEQEEPYIAPAPIVNHQKHYKIIFIKAPSAPVIPQQLQSQSISEEKTLVYVLVKKPEAPEIRITQPAPVTPSKPEVYFIKYKTEKDQGASLASSSAPVLLSAPSQGPGLLSAPSQGPGLLSAPSQGPGLLSAPSQGSGLLSAPSQGSVLLSAPSQGPSPAAIALPAPSSSSVASDNSLLSLGSSQASSVIQPRNPSPVYGPAH